MVGIQTPWTPPWAGRPEQPSIGSRIVVHGEASPHYRNTCSGCGFRHHDDGSADQWSEAGHQVRSWIDQVSRFALCSRPAYGRTGPRPLRRDERADGRERGKGWSRCRGHSYQGSRRSTNIVRCRRPRSPGDDTGASANVHRRWSTVQLREATCTRSGRTTVGYHSPLCLRQPCPQ